ncbi:hypothetical protein [Sphingomonas koreensis]
MITLNHPDVLAHIRGIPAGLIPIRLDGKLALAIKAQKESLLAIQQNRGFRFYVVPIDTTDGTIISLVTAFFDDADEPLVIRTPLFGDEQPSGEIVAILMALEVDIYFFDEHTREWMSYRCRLDDPGSYLQSSSEVRLAPFSHGNSTAMLRVLGEWFSYRTPADDDRAIRVVLEEELWPSDIAILDAREGANAYHGTDGFSLTMLTRDEVRPGYYQERDIVAGFKRFLDPDQIILNPGRRASGKEFADVVVGTGDAVILVQAKDSPNTAKSLARSLNRKLKTSEHQFDKALSQAEGALSYAKDGDPVKLVFDGLDADLHIAGRRILNLVIIKEVFPSQAGAVLAAIARFSARGDFLVVLDYPAFSAFTHHFPHEERFVCELEDFARQVVESGNWVDPQQFLFGRFLDRVDAAG